MAVAHDRRALESPFPAWRSAVDGLKPDFGVGVRVGVKKNGREALSDRRSVIESRHVERAIAQRKA